MKTTKLAGFDLETSGTDPAVHGILQVALVMKDNGNYFMRRVKLPEDVTFTYEAQRVNGIDTATAYNGGDDIRKVDEELLDFIEKNVPGGLISPVGFNVAGFDMQFVKRWLPRSYERFSYHTVDLNAPIVVLAKALDLNENELKTRAKGYAEGALMREGFAPTWHDALYDARASLRTMEYLILLARHSR